MQNPHDSSHRFLLPCLREKTVPLTMVIDCDIGNSPFSGGAVLPPQEGSKTRWLESWGGRGSVYFLMAVRAC